MLASLREKLAPRRPAQGLASKVRIPAPVRRSPRASGGVVAGLVAAAVGVILLRRRKNRSS